MDEHKNLQVLLIEDSPDDARLIRERLAEADPWIEIVRAETLSAGINLLARQGFACVLLDLDLPDASMLEGLEAVRKTAADVPVAVLTGRDDEQIALQAVRAGAQDYLTKRRMSGARISKGVRYAIERHRLETAQQRESEHRFHRVVDSIREVFWMTTPDRGTVEYVSPAFEEVWGMPVSSLVEDPLAWLEPVVPDDKEEILANLATRPLPEEGEHFECEFRIRRPSDGAIRWIRTRIYRAAGEEDQQLVVGVSEDFTERKETEVELRRALDALQRTDAERRRLLASLVKAQEEERARIAADIHDDPLQSLFAVKMRLELLNSRGITADLDPPIDGLMDAISDSAERLRGLLFDLRPPALDREGLEAALRAYLEHTLTDEPIDWAIYNRLGREPDTASCLILYRIAQEAITNVRKHASASKLTVVLVEQNDGTAVRVSDNGRGFDPDTRSAPGHLGLASMRERAEQAGGWLHVASKPEVGSSIEFWIPDARASENDLYLVRGEVA